MRYRERGGQLGHRPVGTPDTHPAPFHFQHHPALRRRHCRHTRRHARYRHAACRGHEPESATSARRRRPRQLRTQAHRRRLPQVYRGAPDRLHGVQDRPYAEERARPAEAFGGHQLHHQEHIARQRPDTARHIPPRLRHEDGHERGHAHQHDEQVYQIVHIAVPSSATTLIGNIDTILGVGTTPAPSVEDGD